VEPAKQEVRSGARPAAIRRRFRLVDAMILVAATAIGCGTIDLLSRATVGGLSPLDGFDEVREFFHQSPGEIGGEGVAYFFAMISVLVSPIVAAWTLALLPIRLIDPRPRWRRVACQPGMMAACASAFAIAGIGLLICGLVLVCGSKSDAGLIVESAHGSAPMFVGLAVSISWMTLLVGRRWRAERSWVDRFGRAVGCFWIASGLLLIFVIVLGAKGQSFTASTPLRTSIPAQVAGESDETASRSEGP
jgi:hypothetical protein